MSMSESIYSSSRIQLDTSPPNVAKFKLPVFLLNKIQRVFFLVFEKLQDQNL